MQNRAVPILVRGPCGESGHLLEAFPTPFREQEKGDEDQDEGV